MGTPQYGIKYKLETLICRAQENTPNIPIMTMKIIASKRLLLYMFFRKKYKNTINKLIASPTTKNWPKET